MRDKSVDSRRGVFAGIAAAAISVAGFAAAQPSGFNSSQPLSPPAPTEAEIAASPAAKRLLQLIEAVNSGNDASILAFVQKNHVPASEARTINGKSPAVSVLELHRRSRGFTLIGIRGIQGEFASALVRNNLTGLTETLSVHVEEKEPHRIVGLPIYRGDSPDPAQTTPPAGLPAGPAGGPIEAAKLKEIETYVQRLADADAFSGVVLIAREGEPILSKSYGQAIRARSVRNSPDTPFRLASVNKLFTAIAIAQLVEQGKLSYEDQLSKFIPDFPDKESAKKIRIKHLLSHTSGLGSYQDPEVFTAALPRLRTIQSFIGVADRKPPAFEPGANFRYSNYGYLLLGRVIELATGTDYYEYMAKSIFVPAGMKNSGFPHYDRGGEGAALPYEYELKNDQLVYADQSPNVEWRGSSFGSGVSTAQDLLRLANALSAGKLVKPETLRLLSTPKPELNAPEYGFGFHNARSAPGRDIVGHSGNAPGQCAEFATIRDLPAPYTIIVLSNSPIGSCGPVVKKIYAALTPVSGPRPLGAAPTGAASGAKPFSTPRATGPADSPPQAARTFNSPGSGAPTDAPPPGARSFNMPRPGEPTNASPPEPQPSTQPQPASITAEQARRTAAEFAQVLEDKYLNPETGRRYAEALRARIASGQYDQVTRADKLADVLTADVQAVARDAHLRIMPAREQSSGPQPKMMRMNVQASEGPVRPMTPGPAQPIEEARWLAPGIAYIRFTEFPYDAAVTAAAVKFMAEHADAKTIIFDIRAHSGGGTAQISPMLSYLFQKEVALLTMDTRASAISPASQPPPFFRQVSSPAGLRRVEHFVTPHPTERRLFDAKVYVLTSGYTASAAEHFALALKGSGRGTLIGETTAGAGNFGRAGMERIGPNFTAFVPFGRAYDPRSGMGWEGSGIEPDIKVSAEAALVEALVRSGMTRTDAERVSASTGFQGPKRGICNNN